jgi:hypothetical protein
VVLGTLTRILRGCLFHDNMAEPATPALATAPDSTASTEVATAVSPTRAMMTRPDLDSRKSFDVEELLQGAPPEAKDDDELEEEALDDSAQPDGEPVEELCDVCKPS